MNMPQHASLQASVVVRRRPKSALNWVDFLVIAATVLTFAVVVIANNPHSRRLSSSWLLKDTSVQTGQPQDVNSDLVKARVKVALSG